MSEQMSSYDLAFAVRDELTTRDAEALIRSDRKATVERCYEKCVEWINANLVNEHRFPLIDLESIELRAILDGVLEEL